MNVAAPAMVRFITRIAARFQIQVTEKAAAQAAPIIGAAGGALINPLFMSHFQNVARGHFTVRSLKRVGNDCRLRLDPPLNKVIPVLRRRLAAFRKLMGIG